MVSFRVVSDSTADVPDRYEIPFAPIHVYVGATDFKDKIDFTKERYLDAEAKGVPLRTAAPSPKDWLSAYRSAGKDLPIVAFTITSRLSSSAKTAKIAAQIAKKDGYDVHVFDTWSGGIGMGLLIREAMKMAEREIPVEKAVELLTKLRGRLRLYVFLSDVRAALRSGRFPALATRIGFALGIRPIVTVVKGKFVLYKLCRTGQAKRTFEDLARGHEELWFSDVNGGELAEDVWNITQKTSKSSLRIPIGPGLSVHFGRDAFGIGFFE